MKTKTTTHKTKTINSIESEPSIKYPADADAQPPLISPQLASKATCESKQAKLIAQLHATPGVTLKEMMALTGWQAHTVRGMISGILRKKLGFNVICDSSAKTGECRYRIVNSAIIV